MERRNVIIAVGSGLVAAVAAACGSARSSSSTTTVRQASATSTSVGTPARRHKPTTTSSTSSTTSTSTTVAPTTTSEPTTTSLPPSTTTTEPFPGWPAIARASSVPVGGTVAFTFGSGSAHDGAPGILYQPSAGVFVALDTVCTHLNIVPCNLDGTKLVCPRHGSEFALSTGAVINGPAVQPLARASVGVRPDGFVWFEADA